MRFAWLHLSDLHQGARATLNREPTNTSVGDTLVFSPGAVSRALTDDLADTARLVAPWSAVFLTGDVGEYGRAYDYEQFDMWIRGGAAPSTPPDLRATRRVWEVIEGAGAPWFFAVPGNHDAQRAQTPSLALKLLSRAWHEDEDLRARFWAEGDPDGLRAGVRACFTDFHRWWTHQVATQAGAALSLREGLVPGDFAASFEVEGARVGVVGLNTAFCDVVYSSPPRVVPGALDLPQIEAACGEPFAHWCDRHEVRVLLTHHGPDDLGESSRETIDALAASGRFSLWLHGSTHSPERVGAWALSPHAVRCGAPSLFGLAESLDGGRPMGYLAGRLSRTGGVTTARVWTRLALPDFTRREHYPPRDPTRFALGDDAPEATARDDTPRIDHLSVVNFKGLSDLSVDLVSREPAPGMGCWTCFVGVNGVGKTSLLQAICLVLMGDEGTRQLGDARLGRLVGPSGDAATLRARVLWRGEELDLALRLTRYAQGARAEIPEESSEAQRDAMRRFWSHLATSPTLCAYGASRSLSEYLDTRHEGLSALPRAQITLFDPLSQVAGARVLVGEVPCPPGFAETLQAVLDRMRGLANVQLHFDDGRVSDVTLGARRVPLTQLPDGYRSTIAWVADLVAHARRVAPESSTDPRDLRAIVLVDEIDLHLHGALQRPLIRELRAALPNVQWVITTHAPIIVSSFYADELRLLTLTPEGGVRARKPPQHPMLMTSDQVYTDLLDLEAPTSTELAAELAAAGGADGGTGA